MRLHLTAGGDARGIGRKLKWCDLYIPLTDARYDRVAGVPRVALTDAPFARRNEAGTRARKVDRQFSAEAEAMRHGRDAVDPDAPCGFIEVNVAAVLQSATQIQRAVTTLPPAMKPRIAQIEIP